MTRSAGTWTKAPAESLIRGFNWSADLDAGEDITGVTFAIAVVSGADPAVASMLVGSGAFAGAEVRQRIAAGVAGVTYEVSATITTSTGNTKKACAWLIVEEC